MAKPIALNQTNVFYSLPGHLIRCVGFAEVNTDVREWMGKIKNQGANAEHLSPPRIPNPFSGDCVTRSWHRELTEVLGKILVGSRG